MVAKIIKQFKLLQWIKGSQVKCIQLVDPSVASHREQFESSIGSQSQVNYSDPPLIRSPLGN